MIVLCKRAGIVCVRVCVWCVRVCVRVCVCACVRECASVCVCVWERERERYVSTQWMLSGSWRGTALCKSCESFRRARSLLPQCCSLNLTETCPGHMDPSVNKIYFMYFFFYRITFLFCFLFSSEFVVFLILFNYLFLVYFIFTGLHVIWACFGEIQGTALWRHWPFSDWWSPGKYTSHNFFPYFCLFSPLFPHIFTRELYKWLNQYIRGCWYFLI